MRGLGNDRDNVAINVKLKEGKKNFWFGEVEGGGGYSDKTRYLGSTKLFYYSPETSVNLIGNSNNTGEVSFSFRDYLNFTGGFKNLGRGGGTSFNLRDSGLNFLLTQNDRANEIQNHFGAANFTHELSPKLSISGFSIYGDNSTEFIQHSLRSYIHNNTTEINTSQREQHNRLGLAKLSAVYKPHSAFQLDYDLFLKTSGLVEEANALSVFSDKDGLVENPVLENKENSPLSLSQNANAYYTVNAGNIFAGYFQHLYQEDDPFYNVILGEQPFQNMLPLREGEARYDLNQKRNITTHKFDGKIDYYYVINDLSNINFNMGATLSQQLFDSSIFEVLDSGSTNALEGEEFNNDVKYGFTDIFAGANYKFKKGIFTITPGLSLHKYNLDVSDNKGNTSNDLIMALPSFNAIMQFRQSESLQFTYNMIGDFSDINNLAEGYVFSSYNRLFRGNRKLRNGIFHNLDLNYSNFSMFNFTSIYGGLRYSRRIDAIINNSIIENIHQVTSVINSDYIDETISANGTFQKTFRKFKANLHSNFSLSTHNLIVNDENREAKSFTQNYEGSLETNFKRAPNFEIGYDLLINNYLNAGVENTFLTHRPFANFEANFLNGFTLSGDYSYFNYSDKDNSVKNEYSFLNVKLFYQQPGSQYEFSLDATNLLNVTSINRDSFNEHYNVTTAYFVQPRMVMFSVKYTL